MARNIDTDKLIAFLKQKAVEDPGPDPGMLVRYAIYQGLADRIGRGEFDIDEGKEP